MALDPTRFHVEPHVAMQQQEESFAELCRERLRQTPWLALSLAVHAVVLVVFWLLPPQQVVQEHVAATMQPHEEPVLPDPIQQIVDPKPQDPVVDPTLTDVPLDTKVPEQDSELVDLAQPSESHAIDPAAWNHAVGLGGGGPPRGKLGGRGSRRGAPRPHQEAIDRALNWLRLHQDEDGKWDSDDFMKHDQQGAACDGAGNPVHDVGVTSLALLAFLGDGHDLRQGKHRDVVKRGIHWLRQQQDPQTGLVGPAASHDFIYDHVIAAYALCEAYGLSDAAILRPYAQKAVDYLESHRNPYMVWRYQPRDGDNDTSVTSWAIMVYKSAQDFGLQVNAQALRNAEIWLDQVTDPATGRAGYTKRGEPSSRHPGDHGMRFPPKHGEAMTAAALMSRCFLGQQPKHKPIMQVAANTILACPPRWDEAAGTIDHYYWYYASFALYQIGGDTWHQWSAKLDDAVLRHQRADGNFAGSWDPKGVWGQDGGRVYSTSLLALTLQAYYRYTRLIR